MSRCVRRRANGGERQATAVVTDGRTRPLVAVVVDFEVVVGGDIVVRPTVSTDSAGRATKV